MAVNSPNTGSFKDKMGRMQDGMRLKGKLQELNRQKMNHLVQIGMMAYRAFRAGESATDDSFREEAAGLKAIDVQIAQFDRELARLSGPGGEPCARCGTANQAAAQFCVSCGTNLKEAQGARTACPTCRSPLPEQSRFCGYCGHRPGGA